ncbi:MAG: hypothetical protein ACPG7F_01455 [Aggregatilineales bacterium]
MTEKNKNKPDRIEYHSKFKTLGGMGLALLPVFLTVPFFLLDAYPLVKIYSRFAIIMIQSLTMIFILSMVTRILPAESWKVRVRIAGGLLLLIFIAGNLLGIPIIQIPLIGLILILAFCGLFVVPIGSLTLLIALPVVLFKRYPIPAFDSKVFQLTALSLTICFLSIQLFIVGMTFGKPRANLTAGQVTYYVLEYEFLRGSRLELHQCNAIGVLCDKGHVLANYDYTDYNESDGEIILKITDSATDMSVLDVYLDDEVIYQHPLE